MESTHKEILLKELDHIQAIVGRFDTFFFTSKNVYVVAVSAIILYYTRGDSLNGSKLLALVPVITFGAFLSEYLFRYRYWSGYIIRVKVIQNYLKYNYLECGALTAVGLYLLKDNSSWRKRFREAFQCFDALFYGMFMVVILVYMFWFRYSRFMCAYSSLLSVQ